MAALPDPALVSIEEYLATSYPDGDREYLDGVVVERSLGTPGHSTLQKILIGHFLKFEKPLQLALFPECRLRVTETRYRVVLVMMRPFRQTDRVLLDAPFLIVEVLSPEDSMGAALRRFRDYTETGVPHIILMDPIDRGTFVYSSGDLARRDITGFDVPERGFLPFDSRALLAQLDQE